MSQIAIVYWSGTGHTETMASKIAEGTALAGGNATVLTAAAFNASMMDSYDAVAFGCPSMGAEQLEEEEFEPMFRDCASRLDGKRIALFGSYGWGDGEWMRTWEDECRSLGAILVSDPVTCNEEPDADAVSACIELGKTLV